MKKVFGINGGAGRVLCSIPALLKYYKTLLKHYWNTIKHYQTTIKENYKIDRILNYNVYKSDTWIKK